MQTWRIRLIAANGMAPTQAQALQRYVYGSLWLLPCIGIQLCLELHRWQIIEMLFFVALFLWPLSIYLDRVNPDMRQGIPDRLAGTRQVILPSNRVKLA